MRLLQISLLMSLALTVRYVSADDGGHPAHALWPRLKPALGETAPEFILHDLEEKEFRLKDHVGKKPIVIEFGSYS